MSQLVIIIGEQNFFTAQTLLKWVNYYKHEAMWAIQKQAKKLLTIFLMAEPVFVARNSGDFWIGMKGLPNIV